MHDVRGLDAVYYLAKDYARAAAFYEGLFGAKPTAEFTQACEFVLQDGAAFGIAFQPDFWSQGGGAMFGVADLAAATERVQQLGGRPLGDVVEYPVCHMVWCADTEGNTFALHKRKA